MEALKQELEDPRTWETQYQMIMALGYCGYKDSAPFLRTCSEKTYDATMILMALGHSIVRLEMSDPTDEGPIRRILKTQNKDLISGALMAVGLLGLAFSEPMNDLIIGYARQLGNENFDIVFVSSAASGWPGEKVRRFLTEAQSRCRFPISEAAKMALDGKRWNCEKNAL